MKERRRRTHILTRIVAVARAVGLPRVTRLGGLRERGGDVRGPTQRHGQRMVGEVDHPATAHRDEMSGVVKQHIVEEEHGSEDNVPAGEGGQVIHGEKREETLSEAPLVTRLVAGPLEASRHRHANAGPVAQLLTVGRRVQVGHLTLRHLPVASHGRCNQPTQTISGGMSYLETVCL